MKNFLENKYYFWLIISFISLYVLLVFVKNPGMNYYDRAMFHDIIYGTAFKPYVYRVVIPVATRTLTGLVPEELQNNLSETFEQNKNIKAVLDKFHWDTEDITEYLIACCLMYGFLIGFLYVFRKLFNAVYFAPQWFVNLVTIFVLSALPAMFEYYSYVYDFSNLFLFTLGLYFIKQRKWKQLLVLYLISCFNKETTILLTLVFAIHYYGSQEIDKKLYKNLILIQLLIFAIIKLILFVIFIDNPGVFVEFHLLDRTYLLWNGYTLTTYVIWLVIILVVLSYWQDKPKFLKDALWIAVPLILLTFSLGVWDEWRDYYEVYPVIMLLIAYTAARLIGVEIKNINNEQLRFTG